MATPYIAQPANVASSLNSTDAFYCKIPSPAGALWEFVNWRFFYVRCPQITAGTTCNSTSGAYVSAITVCNQQLWVSEVGI